MSRPNIIGIAGAAQSGKDTTANFLLTEIGGYQYAFADPIRRMIVALGVDMDDPYWQARKEVAIPVLGVSPRRLMQTLGTEWGRQLINNDIWLLMAQRRLMQNGAGMIISDVRFENEAAWVRKCGGLVIHVHRGGKATVVAHESEAGITVAPKDCQLFNNGTLEELQLAVRELADVYR